MEERLVEAEQRPGCVIALGMVLLLLGGGVGALGLLTAVAMVFMRDKFPATDQAGALTSALSIYLLGAAVLVTLGIGVVQAKAWGRSLTIASGWVVIAAGLVALPGTIGILSRTQTGVSLTMFLPVWAMMFLLGPAFMIFALTRPAIVNTFRRRAPAPSPLEEVPLPVVCLGLVSIMGGVYLLLMAPVLQGAVHFGLALPLWAARLTFLGQGVLSIATGLGLLRLRRWAWWLCLAHMGLMTASMVGNALTMGVEDFYRAYGYSDDLIRQLRAMDPEGTVGTKQWSGVVGSAVYAAVLLVYRRRFPSGD